MKKIILLTLILLLMFGLISNLNAQEILPDLKINSTLVAPNIVNLAVKDLTVYITNSDQAHFQPFKIKLYDKTTGYTDYKDVISFAQGNVDFSLAPGIYDLEITIDIDNNIAESDENNNLWTEQVTINVDVIISDVQVKQITTTSATITWKTNIDSNTWVFYGENENNLNFAYERDNQNAVTDHEVILNNLTAGTKYYFKISSRDENNQGSLKAEKTGEFTTESVVSVLPVILLVDTAEITEQQAKIFFTVDLKGAQASNPEINYGTISTNLDNRNMTKTARMIFDYDSQGNITGFSATNIVVGLNPGTTYFYQVVLDKGTSVEVKSSIYSFATPVVSVLPPETSISTPVTQFVQTEQSFVTSPDTALTQRLKGYILLQVEEAGQAWYVDPESEEKYYLPDGSYAYEALRRFGLGITNADLSKIPVGIESRFQDTDTDGDGLPDKLEEALGTNINSSDSDNDGYSDGVEVQNNYNPLGIGKMNFDSSLANRLKGRILLQVESRGEAWYINPNDGKRYYMKGGDAAYQIMRFLSLGITNNDLRKIIVGIF